MTKLVKDAENEGIEYKVLTIKTSKNAAELKMNALTMENIVTSTVAAMLLTLTMMPRIASTTGWSIRMCLVSTKPNQ